MRVLFRFNTFGRDNPTVLTQLQTNANEQYLLTRTDSITGSSFSVMMEAEEGDMSSSPSSEVVGWFAIESDLRWVTQIN